MIDRLLRQSGALYCLLAAYFIVNTVLRLALPASLELDEGQQLFMSQWLSLGYDSQPPFYNWLQYGVVHVLGDSVAALAVLKNLLLFLAYVLFGMTANLLLANRKLAAVATLGLLTIPQISFEAQRDLSHTVAVLFAACLFFYAFMRTLKQPSAWSYALTGFATGIGVLSKYNFVLLPLAAILAILSEREYRARLFDWRLLLTAVIAVAIVLPHAWWFLEHIDIATQRTLGKLIAKESSRIGQIGEGLGALVSAIAAFFLPTLLLLWVAFGRSLSAAFRSSNPSSRLIGRMFIILVAALIALVLFAGATDIKPRWMVPFFFMLPLYLCLKVEASGDFVPAAPRRFAMIALAIMVIVPLALFGRIPVLGAMGHYEKLNVPYGPAIQGILATSRDRPSLVVALDQQLAGTVRLHAADLAVAAPNVKHLQQPYVFDANHPVLLIWRGAGEAVSTLPPELAAWMATQPAIQGLPVQAHDIAMPYHYGRAGDVYHFSYAWLYPAAK